MIFYNPISGGGRASRLAIWARKRLANEGLEGILMETDAGGDYGRASALIEELGITDVLVVGGDGTVNAVIGALRGMEVCFGILPAGSGNGLAFGAGISGNKAKAMALILEGNARHIDAFEVNGKFGCMVYGAGLDGEVAFHFAKGKRRGLYGYLGLVLSSFLKAKKYSFELGCSEFSERVSAYFISIANSNQYGNHFQVAPAASLSDGKLDVVVAASSNKWSLLGDMFRHLLLRRAAHTPDKRRGVIYFQTSSLRLRNEDLAHCHLDGEVAGSPMDIDLRVIPSAFRMYVKG